MKIRISLLIPSLLVIITVASSLFAFVHNNGLAEQEIRDEAQQQLRLDITRLQSILYNLLTGDNFSDARLNISVMAMDTAVKRILLTDEDARVLIANRYSWEGKQAPEFPWFDIDIASRVRQSRHPHVGFLPEDTSLLHGYYPVVIKIEDSNGLPIKHVGTLFAELSIARKLHSARMEALEVSAFQGGLMLTATLFMGILLHVVVSRRLGSLARSARKLAEGDLVTTFKVRGNDELSNLASVFDNMRERVKTQIHHLQQVESELYEYDDMLEERIKERTEQLKTELENRKALEKQLLHAQKMESLGQLTGGIAHDFNNILAGILGFTQLARRLDVSKAHVKLSEYLAHIQQSGERAASLVTQMLTYSRTEGDVEQKQKIPVAELFDETFSMLRPLIPSNISLHSQTEADDLIINANAVMMSQVLTNLCLNAKDSIYDGQGEIRIEANAVHGYVTLCSSCHQPVKGDFVAIHVSDNGCGICEDVRNRIFDPFFSTKEAGKGSGMGLSMVHGIIHKHGGHISIDSTPGQGTTITIYLPQVTTAVVADEPVINEEPVSYMHDGQHNRILIVDDEPALTDYLSEILELHGYQVTSMNDSRAALAYFDRHKETIDLVVSDQTMPHLLGTDMARAILKISPTFPIILCTGHSEHVSEQQALDMGMAAFMKKPINAERLLKTVKQLLPD